MLRRDGKGGSIELEPLPTTYRHSRLGELSYAKKVLSS
jgi:hypothetical protein